MDAADLAFAGLARQAELVRDGEVSSRELTELYLDRIARLDPQLRAFRVVLAEAALAAADAADGRRGDGAPPLNGVPIAIKDDTDMAGEVTAHGSLAHGGPAANDAEVVRRLRDAGAVLIGKTHVPELEALAATESLAFGATRNPWDPARTLGRLERRLRRPRSRPGSRPPRSPPTAPGRSGSRRPAAVCSGSSRNATACRWGRTGTAWP